MPVVGNRGLGSAPAAERSGSADTISYGHSPEPTKKLSGLLEEAADLGLDFIEPGFSNNLPDDKIGEYHAQHRPKQPSNHVEYGL